MVFSSFILHDNLMRKAIFTDTESETQRLSHSPKITQLVTARVGVA